MDDNNEKDSKRGIRGLPRPWSIAVQVVGTFGLAVFLVLYYVIEPGIYGTSICN